MPNSENSAYKSGLLVSSSPHLVTSLDTQKTMLYVLYALAPAAIAATMYYGPSALIRIFFGMIFSVICEWCYNQVMRKPDTTGDLSAAVTGVILAMNVPADFPLWMLAIGCIVAIVVVKCLYGGIGRNIANPALVGRVVIFLSWTNQMSTWPLTVLQKKGVDALTGATPLGSYANGAIDELPSLFDMYIGNIGGAMGEACTAAIILGAIFLVWKKVITPIIPCAFIGTVFVISLFYFGFNGGIGSFNVFESAMFEVLAGGVVFGAVFCATDYVTSPVMKVAQLIFGIGCGAVTMMIRLLGSYPEGVSFAILFMNILCPLIERFVERQYYGIAKREKEAKKAAKEAAK